MENLTLLRSDLLKLQILFKLIDKNSHSPSELSILLNTNAKTILRNSKFLELLNLIEIDVKKTNKNYYFLTITNIGFSFYQKHKDSLIEMLR